MWQTQKLIFRRYILTCSIRPLDKEDIAQVNAIDREAFPTQWPPPNYRQELNNRLAHYIVADDISRLLDPPAPKPPGGLRTLASRFLPWIKRAETAPPPPRPYIAGFSGIWMMVDEAHITNIAVRKEYQCQGIGSLLLIATFDLAQKFNATLLTLEVRASNATAQKLYTRYGFARTGLRRGYYLDNREDAIIMSTESISSPSFQANLQQLRESLARKLHPSANL
jgi:ribosomal-protein-alanine N-acetyltransferase